MQLITFKRCVWDQRHVCDQRCSLVLVRAVTLMSVSYHTLKIETKNCARDAKGCLGLIGVVHLQCCVSVCMHLCV